MSGSRKALKVISILMIVGAVLYMLLGILAMAGFSLLGDTSALTSVEGVTVTTEQAGLVAGAMGVMFIIMGIFYLIVGFLGLRGVKDPQKIGPFFVLSIIGAVLGVIGLIGGIAGGTFTPTSLISLALVIACVILANNVKKEA